MTINEMMGLSQPALPRRLMEVEQLIGTSKPALVRRLKSPAVRTKSTFVDSPVREGGLRLYSPAFQWRESGQLLVPIDSSIFINRGLRKGTFRRLRGLSSQSAQADFVPFVARGFNRRGLGGLQRVRAMQDSVTYQANIRKGRVAEAQAILLRQGNKRFGPSSDATRLAIESITAIDRLELLLDRLLDVESWDELLAE